MRILTRAFVGFLVAALAWPVLSLAIFAARMPGPAPVNAADLPASFPLLATWTDPLGNPYCRAILHARLPDLRSREREVSLAMPGTHAAACEESFASFMDSGLWPNPLPNEEPRSYRSASFSVEGSATGIQRVTVSYELDDDWPNRSSYTVEGDSLRDAELLSYFGPGVALFGAMLAAPAALLVGLGVSIGLGWRRTRPEADA